MSLLLGSIFFCREKKSGKVFIQLVMITALTVSVFGTGRAKMSSSTHFILPATLPKVLHTHILCVWKHFQFLCECRGGETRGLVYSLIRPGLYLVSIIENQK